jgi:hypothetical protein
MSDQEPKTEGWTEIYPVKKFHYFRDRRSLCGKFKSPSLNYYQLVEDGKDGEG